ncbi:hypothetical protein OH492_09410 [Vibrio chagasii]|nr:hypothetical protein [Vibrio chagasii]
MCITIRPYHLKLDTEKSRVHRTNIRRHFITRYSGAAERNLLSIGALIYRLLYSQLNINICSDHLDAVDTIPVLNSLRLGLILPQLRSAGRSVRRKWMT